LISLALALTAATAAAGEPLHLAPTKGVVLLRNGQVLEGTIARTGDYYYISKPGSEIRLKTSEVEKVAERVEELYEEKRSHLDPTKMQNRLDLAEWCVEQKLVEQAASELAEAALLEPGHPRLILLQRRLDLARRGAAETTPVPHAAENGPSTEELDRFVRGLPGHAVETFTSSIQPLLVNNCTNSGCHGTQSAGKLRLLRLPFSGTVNRRRTQRNLYAAWQVIDADRPASSPLLTQPVQPHGNAKGPIFSGREQAQYRQLVSWVYEITRQRRPQEPPGEDAPDPLPRHATKSGAKKSAKVGTKPSEAGEANHESPGKAAAHDPEDPPGFDTVPLLEENAGDEKAARKGQRIQAQADDEYVPTDAFDPEIFNRRYLPPE
jgi:hypothetical protein